MKVRSCARQRIDFLDFTCLSPSCPSSCKVSQKFMLVQQSAADCSTSTNSCCKLPVAGCGSGICGLQVRHGAIRQAASTHYESFKYLKATSKAHVKALQNLIVSLPWLAMPSGSRLQKYMLQAFSWLASLPSSSESRATA